jgi:hypothetical protein
MEWMNGEGLEDRRTGRTFVLALAALRNACNHLNRWLPVEDHHHDNNSDQLLMTMIHSLADQAGIVLDVQHRRFCVVGMHPDARRFLFEEFVVGEPRLGIPEHERRNMRRRRGEQEPVVTPEIVRRSQWERLDDDDAV